MNAETTQDGNPIASAVGVIERYIHGATSSDVATRNAVRALDVNLAELTQYVRDGADFAHNANAEFQARGDHHQALTYSEQAQRYQHVEFLLTREALARENSDRLIAGLRRVRTEVGRTGSAILHSREEAEALLAATFGSEQGTELLQALSSGVSRGTLRETRIRDFVLTAEKLPDDSHRYSVITPEAHRLDLKHLLTQAIRVSRERIAPETSHDAAAVSLPQVSPEAPGKELAGTTLPRNLERGQESPAESRAKSMATATVVPAPEAASSKKKSRAIEGTVVSTPKAARATKQAAKSTAAEMETPAPAVMEPQTPAVEASPAAEIAHEQTPAQAADVQHWSKWRDSPDKLPEAHVEQAKQEYSTWSQKNPDKAANITFEQYRDYRIEQSTKKEAKALDAVEQAVVAAGAPSDKSWRLQKDGYEKLSPEHKAAAQLDYAKYVEKNGTKGNSIEAYTAAVQEYSAKDKAMGTAMLIAKGSVDRGTVTLSANDQANHFLKSAFDGKRTGTDALSALRPTVEPGQSKSITLKDAFTITVERDKADKVVRTSLAPLPGKEAEVKRMFDNAASIAFRRAGYEPQTKGRTQAKNNDLGR